MMMVIICQLRELKKFSTYNQPPSLLSMIPAIQTRFEVKLGSSSDLHMKFNVQGMEELLGGRE